MKIYVAGNGSAKEEIDAARLLGADIALAERSGVLTIIYPLSEEAKEKTSRLNLREVETQLNDKGYVIVLQPMKAKTFLEEKLGENLEIIEIAKDPS